MSVPQLLPHHSQPSFPEAKALGAASALCSVADHIKHEEQPGLLPNTVTKRRSYSSWDLLVALSFEMPDWDTGKGGYVGTSELKHQERDCPGHETLFALEDLPAEQTHICLECGLSACCVVGLQRRGKQEIVRSQTQDNWLAKVCI